MVNYAPDVEFAAKILGPLDQFLALPRKAQDAILDQTIRQLPEELRQPAFEILTKGIEAHLGNNNFGTAHIALEQLVPTR
jgi:hypothetical protein